MIRLTLADGTPIYMNPVAISYIQPLSELGGSHEKEDPKTKVVLLSGESLSVRQPLPQILKMAGHLPKKARERETD